MSLARRPAGTAIRRAALCATTLATALAVSLAPLSAPGAWAAKPTKPGGGGGGSTSEAAYAAIGDSFAAGQGARSYLDTTCYRSSKSYPKLLDAEATLQLVSFPACSGASTTEVIAQASGLPTVKVVTVTVGGNDVGFGAVMQHCFILVNDTSCRAAITAGTQTAQSLAFDSQIQAVVAAVRASSGGANATARVMVTGYPQLFHEVDGVNRKYKWGDEVNDATQILNQEIAAAVSSAGATFVDMESVFAGHGIGSSSPWINDWSLFRQADSFHPNATGYASGYTVVLRNAGVTLVP